MTAGKLTDTVGTEKRDPPCIVLSALSVENHYGKGSNRPWDGLVDSGADRTVIPETLIAELGLKELDRIWVRGYDGARAQRPVYYCKLVVAGLGTIGVRPLASKRDYVLLGRDFLCSLGGLILASNHASSAWYLSRSSLCRRLLCWLLG